MNIVFMGTSDFAVPALRALVAEKKNGERAFSVKLVFTRPNAASGRGKTLIPSPVRVCAEEFSLPVITPLSFYLPVSNHEEASKHDPDSPTLSAIPKKRTIDPKLVSLIETLDPDCIVVAAYGMILPQRILDIPRYGCVNIHASLLPRWRGAAPIQRAILAGDTTSGVSLMRMEAGLDTGAVCCMEATSLEGKNASELTAELGELGARLLLQTLPKIAAGTVTWQTQTKEGQTYADKIEKSELGLDPSVSAVLNVRRVLASTPQAPARCLIGERSVTILDAGVFSGTTSQKGVVEYLDDSLVLSTVDGSFQVSSLKPDGKRAMDASAFVAGFKELRRDSQSVVTWSSITRATQ